jgi:hypothetical protein
LAGPAPAWPTRAAPAGAAWRAAAGTLGLAAGVVLFLFLACDGRLHWDEAGYLYTGGFLDWPAILKGEFLGGIYLSRMLHIAVIATIVDVVGPGITALAILIGLYFAALLLVACLAYLILRELLSDARGLGLAVICGMFTPIFLYFAFKTMPEIPALAMSSTAAWALLCAFRGSPLIWLPAISLALAAAAFLKAEMTLLYMSLVATLLLFGAERYPRGKLIGYALVSGLGALAVFAGALWALGIELADYLMIGRLLLSRDEPLVAKLLHFALEGGVFFLALPLALLSSRRRDAWFCLTWFLLASAPVPLVIAHLESRYLATNLIPLIGLIHLAADGLAPRVAGWWRRSRPAVIAAAGLALLIVVGSNLLALSIMTHELRIDQLHRLIARLDQAYAGRGYAILTPYTYTDFHYLRFAYPELPIYTVQTVFERPIDNASYYPGRVVPDLTRLSSVEGELVYLGFRENLSVENLRWIVGHLPLPILARQFERKQFLNHLALSWMWGSADLVFEEPLREGHYLAYPVRLRSSGPASRRSPIRRGIDQVFASRSQGERPAATAARSGVSRTGGPRRSRPLSAATPPWAGGRARPGGRPRRSSGR